MAMYRKLGKASAQRNALLRNQVTQLLYHGKIRTTEARAKKEVVKIAEKLITLAVKEKDNYDEVTVTAKVAKKDKDGKRIKEVVDGKQVTVYDEVEKRPSKKTSHPDFMQEEKCLRYYIRLLKFRLTTLERRTVQRKLI